jgi:DtxR family Mn-dependent transcriptional regulator|nr:metal-dependent transcriptional regulator [Deltaproteobacteria bacterium]
MKNKKTGNTVPKPLTHAMEDYLEAIFNLDKEKRVVRVKDIAKRLGVKMPTVTNMLKTLSRRELINYEKYEYLELTDDGRDIGKEIYRRHCVLRSFLMDILNIDPAIADEEACKMEHAISSSTLDRFIAFMEFVQSCPRVGTNWLDRFDEYGKKDKNRAKCLEHMKEFVDDFKEKIEAMEKRRGDHNGPQ